MLIGDVPGQQVVQGQRRAQGGEGFDHELIGGFGVAHQLGGTAADVLAARRLKLLRAEGGVEQGRGLRAGGGCARRGFGALALLLPRLFLLVHLFQIHRVQAGSEEPRQARRVIRARRRLLPQRQNMRHPLTHQGVRIQGTAWQADLQFLLHKILRRALLRHAHFWQALFRNMLFRRCFSQPIFCQFSLFSSFS